MTPVRCIVDTNVPVTANGGNAAVSHACATASAQALRQITLTGHVFLDAGRGIMEEYQRNLAPFGQPHAGNVFFKWLLTNEWNPARVTHVALTPKADDSADFEELPSPPGDVRYDRSDRKFLAVSAAHPEHPPILQASDSKWWGWQEALAKSGISVHFLCSIEIARKYTEKMGS